MPVVLVLALACAGTAVLTWAAVGVARKILLRHAVMDRPNPRSSHVTPRPRGAGLGLLPVLAFAWIAAAAGLGAAPPGFAAVLAGAAILAVVSWIDDVKGGTPVVLRLSAQVIAVIGALATFQDVGPVFQGLLPLSLDRMATAILWLWFINLFNFMDGIDGISGVEVASVGTGLALVSWLAVLAPALTVLPAVLAAAAVGFLVWNWAPAKIFLGDVGSVPLGYMLGWLVLLLAAHGHWQAALILPLYSVADTTITLARRLVRGETIWRAHREHFYQRAVTGGASHAAVATQVLLCNIALMVLAVAAVQGFGWPALFLSAVVVGVVLARFSRSTSRH